MKNSESKNNSDKTSIPFYNVDATAGFGSIIENEKVVDSIGLSKKFLKENGLSSPENLAFIKVAGDSMTPTLHSGDMILLDHSITKVVNSGIYVFRQDGELFVKRFMKAGKNILQVISDNKDLYPSYQINLSDEVNADFQIIARVVYHCHKPR